MQSDHDQWICPSFNSYSGNNNLAQIVSKVTSEGDGDNVQFGHDCLLPSIEENYYQNVDDDEDDDFEFSLVLNDEIEVSGEEIVFGSKSQPPFFPIFNRDLLNSIHSEDREGKGNVGNSHMNYSNIPSSSSSLSPDTIKVPLSKLFIEECEDHEPPSSSSSEADEVESIPPGRYCVWKAKATPPSPSTCNKSKSTGFGSKRWKLRDLLRRSNSDGKDSFIFLTPKRKEEKNESKKNKSSNNVAKGKKSTTITTSSSPTRRMTYSPANRDIMRGYESPNRSPKSTKGKSGEIMPKRKSYLPYRQDLVGFFTTVNSIGRNFSPL